MARMFMRILISVFVGWGIGVTVGRTFWPDSNLGPLIPIFVAVPLTYLASFLIAPLLTRWLDRLR